MNRGQTEAETCALNGWGPGTVIRGFEEWRGGTGVWTTIRITAIGDEDILARCLRHETTVPHGTVSDEPCSHREGVWTLRHREWSEVDA